jgi:pimeloyl-ACP methyl ester carboxylesterase
MRARATAAVFALTVAGVGALAFPAPAAGTLSWGPCDDTELRQAGAQCAVLQVPADHAEPRGATIGIALSRIAATAKGTDYFGPLISNPGGPGVPGLREALDLAAQLPPEIAGHFDLIGFDPRGTGSSEPALRCDPGYFVTPARDYVPADPNRITGTEQQRRDAAAAYVRACEKINGDALAHQRTLDAARDLDRIRAALGSSTISYVGNSYGSYLGEVYASTFPTRVARMLLTGVVAPDGVGYRGDVSSPDIARAYERNIDAFFAWVAAHHVIYRLGAEAGEVERHYYADRAALRARPAHGMGPAEWTALFSNAAYSDDVWPALAQGWAAWDAGRPAPFAVAVAGSDGELADRYNAAYLSIACSDGRWPRDYARLRADSLHKAAFAPFITWLFHWQLSAMCATWPVTGRPVRVGSPTPSMLLVNATYDAPTPFADAQATRQAFPHAALLEISGALGHGGNSLWGNSCAQAVAFRYLLTGDLPARTPGAGPDARCDRAPGPDYPEIALAAVGELMSTLDPLIARWPTGQIGH